MSAIRQAEAPELIPRRALLAGGTGLVALLLGVGGLRLAGWRPARSDADVVRQRLLHFTDLPDGGIAIVDAASGRQIERVYGEQGFLRGTLRGLARERRRRGLSGEAPLALLARADGRLTLLDPATGERLDLESFGPDNAAVYARWLGPVTTPTDLLETRP